MRGTSLTSGVNGGKLVGPRREGEQTAHDTLIVTEEEETCACSESDHSAECQAGETKVEGGEGRSGSQSPGAGLLKTIYACTRVPIANAVKTGRGIVLRASERR